MIHPAKLEDIDRGRFSDAVEESFRIASRHQFFVWSQSSLQALIPHEILICGIEDGSRQGMAVHRFSASRYFRQEHFSVVADPLNGLMPRMMAVAEGNRSSVIFCPSPNRRAAPMQTPRTGLCGPSAQFQARPMFGSRT